MMENVFPAPREQLWRVLNLHPEDDDIGEGLGENSRLLLSNQGVGTPNRIVLRMACLGLTNH